MYLGYKANESYGLSLKVKAKRTEQHLFDEIDIFGEIINNHIHHNYMGFYSWGAYGMKILNNEVSYNVLYGIDPHDHSDSIIIDGNYVHNNGSHGIICSTDCTDLTITNNLVENNRHGIMLHKNITHSLVKGNTLINNREVGVALYESHHNIIEDNFSMGNTDGIRLSAGSEDNLIIDNNLNANHRYSLYTYKGGKIPAHTDGINKRNKFIGNHLEVDARNIKISESDDTQFIDNTFDAPITLILEDTTNTDFLSSNTFPQGFNIKTNSDFKLGLGVNQSIVIKNPEGILFQASAPYHTRSFPSISQASQSKLLLTNSGTEVTEVYVKEQGIMVSPNIDHVRSQPIIDSIHGAGLEILTALPDQEIRIEYENLTPNTFYDLSRIQPGSSDSIRRIIRQQTDDSGQLVMNVSLHKDPFKLEYYLKKSPQGELQYTGSTLRDSHVSPRNKGIDNFSHNTQLAIKTDLSNVENKRIAYISFDISQLSSINQAMIELNTRLHIPGSIELAAIAVEDATWNAGDITWNNRPTLGEELYTIEVNSQSFTPQMLDITSYLQALKAEGKTRASIALISKTPSHAIVYVKSKEFDIYQSGEFVGPLLHVQP